MRVNLTYGCLSLGEGLKQPSLSLPSLHTFTHLPIHPPTHPIHLPIHVHTHLLISSSIYLPTYPSIHLPIHPTTYISTHLFIHPSTYPSTYLSSPPLPLLPSLPIYLSGGPLKKTVLPTLCWTLLRDSVLALWELPVWERKQKQTIPPLPPPSVPAV